MSKSQETKTATRPPGRPSKYRSEYCEQLIDFCTARVQDWKIIRYPGTFEEFSLEINVNIDTINEWVKVHPEFSVAKKKAKIAQKKFYSMIGRMGMMGQIKGFSPAVWIFWMKACFGYSDFGPQDNDEDDCYAVGFSFER